MLGELKAFKKELKPVAKVKQVNEVPVQKAPRDRRASAEPGREPRARGRRLGLGPQARGDKGAHQARRAGGAGGGCRQGPQRVAAGPRGGAG